MPHRRPLTPPPGAALVRLAVLLAATLVALLSPAAARADGTPNIALAIDAQDTVLFGAQSTVALATTDPAGQPTGHNLSYRVVLPAGVAYVASSAGAAAGEPTQITDQPATGSTTLLWRNLADLAPGTTHRLGFKVAHTAGAFSIAQSFAPSASAYVNSAPSAIPAFSATGAPVGPTPGPSSYTGSSENKTDPTTIVALQIEQTSDGAPEDELLRGVHANQPLYAITIRGNAVAQTTDLALDDYLPAGLEFLGCGGPGADGTSDAPTNPGSAQEYPGAGPITVAAVPTCTPPTLVETVSADPPGPAPAGIYTHVQWSSLGSLAANATVTLRFRAAIPLRSNTLTWTAGTPATSGAQTANLDNNSGPEVADETALTSHARVTGDFNHSNTLVSADAALTRTAEDLVVRKTADSPTLAQGAATRWDLAIQTSEYRAADDVVITDALPDGLCPIQTGTNLTHAPQDASDLADCAAGSPDPSAPYASAVEASDGTWQLTWNDSTDVGLAQIAPSSTHHILFSTRARTHYQQAYADAAPVLAGDVVTNTVHAAAIAGVACAGSGSGAIACPTPGTEIAHDGPLAAAVADDSSATLTAASPTIDARIANPGSAPVDCNGVTYTDGTPPPAYLPGDRICWQLRVNYPTGVDTQGGSVVDALPSTLTFDPAFGSSGDRRTGADTIAGATFDSSGAVPGPGGALRWTLPSAYVSGGIFEHEIATTVGLPPLPAASGPGDITSNVLKSSASTTGGSDAGALRDQASYRLSMPVMSTQKRIIDIDGTAPNAPNGVTNRTVRGGQTVTFRVRLANTGDATAEAIEVWDLLPSASSCADIVALSISDGGVCSGGVIRWGAAPGDGPDVAPLTTKDLTYKVLVPTTLQPGEVLSSRAGIREFQTTTNTGTAFVYTPDDNIDPTRNAAANVIVPSAAVVLIGARPVVTETRDTLTTESNGGNDYNTNDTATIGEVVRYTVTTVVPAGITVRDLDVTDVIDSRQEYVAGSLANAGAAPASLAIAADTITLSLGSTYTAPTGADTTFAFTFDARVRDATNNFRTGADLSNPATALYTPAGSASGTPRFSSPGNVVTTQLVEPAIIVDTVASVGGAAVTGGQTVGYLITVSAGSGTASPAHDTVIVDDVPTGLTPLTGLGVPVTDGGSTSDGGGASPGGVWDETARTLTFTASATIYPASAQAFSYDARVNDPAIGGSSLTSTVTARTTSLLGAVAGERSAASARTTGYVASDTNTLSVGSASVSKTSPDATLTPGQATTYTVDVTIPAGTIHYDTLVKDVVPDSLDFDGFVSEACTSGCAPGPTTPTFLEYTPVVAGDGTTTVAWDLGDLAASAPATRTFRLIYRAHLRHTHRSGGANVVAGQTAANAVRVYSNRTDGLPAASPGSIQTGPYEDTSAPSTKTVTVVEPGVAFDETIAVNSGGYGSAGVTVHDGDTLHYRLAVTNTGNAPLHDVTVAAQPDGKLAAVTLAAGVSTTANTQAWVAPGDDLKWELAGPIAAGATVTLDYTATPRAVGLTSDGETYATVASVPSAFGLPAATRSANPTFLYRTYATATDSTTATLDAPDVTVVKTTGAGAGPSYPDTAPVEVGEAFGWRVTVTNTSTDTATNLVVRDTLPPNWTYVPGSASFAPGGVAAPVIAAHASGDDLVWTPGLTLAPGASRVLTYQARPSLAAATTPGTGAGHPHTNTASATVGNGAGHSADADGPFAGGPDTAAATLVVPTLTLSATPDGGAASSGSAVALHVIVKNTGTVTATNVSIADVFPSGTTYTAGQAIAVPSAGFSETAGTASAASWTIASLAPGDSVDITAPVVTDPAAPAATLLTNSASVTSDQTATAVSDTATVTLTPSADLVASASGAPNPATAGQPLTYTLRATNNGPSVAQAVAFESTLPTTVIFMSASPGCTYASGTRKVTCAYAGATGVGVSRTATVLTAVVPGTTTDADVTVTASSTTADPAAANDSATVLVPVGARADLSLVKTASSPSVAHGATVEFTLALHNAGPSDATGVQVVDTLPAGLTYVSDDAGCSVAGQVLTCPVGGLLKDSGGTIHVVAAGTTTGPATNSATISATTAEPSDATAPNTGTAAVTVVPAADLALTKTAATPTVAAGGDVTYTLEATNQGPDAASGVVITDPLPAGMTFVSGSAGCSAAAPTVSCTVGALANGASASREIVVRAGVTLGAQAVTNTASVAGAQADPVPGDNAASASVQVGPAADVSVTATAPPTATAGTQTTFTLVAHNDGPSDATGVVVTAALPAGITLAQAAPAQGNCSEAGGTVTCALGTLGAGGSAIVALTVNLPAAAAGASAVLGAQISATEPDPVPANASGSASVQVLAPPPVQDPGAGPGQGGGGAAPAPAGTASVSVTKVADGVARAGERLTYTITATNHGPSSAKDVVVTDALVAGVTFLSAKSSGVDCTFKSATIRCPIGTIANGDSVRITVAVTPKKAGMIVNNAFLAASTLDPNVADNRAVASGTAPTQKPTKLRIHATSPKAKLRGGDVLSYTLRVRNTGKVTAVNVDTCDVLPAGLAFASTRGGALVDSRLCFHQSTLAPGKSRVYRVKVRVLPRAKKGPVTNRTTTVADNAKRATDSVRSQIVTDGKVAAEQVHGFTG